MRYLPATPCRLLLAVLAVASAVACGKKGPPLAPFPRVPARVDNLSPSRIGNDIYLSFPVPSANVDGRKPADIGSLEIYGITTTRPPQTMEERKLATLLTTLTVRPPLPEPPANAPAEVVEAVTAAIPGLDQGGQAVFSEAMTDELKVPIELPEKKPAVAEPVIEAEEEPFGTLVAPVEKESIRRYYFVVAVSPRGREGPPSEVVSVPFGETSGVPGPPQIDYTENTMVLRWDPSPNAKTWSLAPVPPPKPPAPPPPPPPVDEPVDPLQPPVPVKPPAPVIVEPPLLTAKSLGFTTQATLYHVYEVPKPAATKTGDVPSTPAVIPKPPTSSVPTIAKPLTPQPIDKNELELKSVVFGVERCFYLRAVDTVFGMPVQGPPSEQRCVTPVDTFPPKAPTSLAAIAGAGVINLIWDASTDLDLAGYIVLRGEAPGDRLLPLTPEPIRETTFPDRNVQPGVRYVYAVVAVDNAKPPNQSAQSNRTEETARQ